MDICELTVLAPLVQSPLVSCTPRPILAAWWYRQLSHRLYLWTWLATYRSFSLVSGPQNLPEHLFGLGECRF
jgi:hypothetical protein